MNPPTSAQGNTVTATTAPTARGVHLYSFVLGLLVAGCLMGGSLWLLRRPEPPPITLHPPPTPAPTATPAPTPTPGPITVFVSGAVRHPGLYTLAADARVGDVLASAGGLTQAADPAVVNQAEPLWDGAQVHVPEQIEEESLAAAVGATRGGQPPAGVSGSASTPAAAGAVPPAAAGGLINLNTATAGQLETLPGIGPSKAQAIVENRPYAAVDELERVPGIGAKTVEQLRPFVAAP